MTAPTEPGIYRGVPDEVYHADRASLSSSGARRLSEISPWHWKYEQDHPTTKSKDHFDLGKAVHTLVLGTGAPLVDLGVDEIRTKEAKTQRQAEWDAGRVPLRSKDYQRARDMADAVMANRHAQQLLASGEPELSAWYRDPVSRVMLRARPDWTHWVDRNTAILVDVKKSTAPTPEVFRSSVLDFGYFRQQPWYQAAWDWFGIDTEFVFIVVCDAPPHPVYAVRLKQSAVELGARLNRRDISLYAECRRSGIWPHDGDPLHEIDLPSRAYYTQEKTTDDRYGQLAAVAA
ncbi:PD-(D/E)XK nuclease-like domain-containing protein [Nocardia sp. CA-290969]|uniref:PD-(D/E)XK nuclease-like domain-containing protein n=1 Tax=Nocardia sp. CA-290969 TaxID=3239986 RepID=UPI003D8B8EE9